MIQDYSEVKVLLLEYTNFWGFPKGRIEKSENPKEAAIRELWEETGLKPLTISEDILESIEYNYKLYGEWIYKTVHYFGAIIPDKEVKLSYEHNNYELVPTQNVISQLKYENIVNAYKSAYKWIISKILDDQKGDQREK